MSNTLDEDLKQRILDRYEVDELAEVLELSVSDILEAFAERVEARVEDLDI